MFWGTPSIVLMISTGKSAAKSSTTSNDGGSRASATAVIFARIIGSSAAIARGVNTLLTSLRITVCSGGSIMMINGGCVGSGSARYMSKVMPLADE